MKISIITVSYNEERNIESTILSVLEQTYNKIEYILIDGGSTDSTINVVSQYLCNIDIIVSEKDYGIYDAINKGIKLASGEYIVILNANDAFYSKDTIQNIVNFHSKYDCSISLGDVIYKDKNSRLLRYYSAKLWFPALLYLGYMPPHQASVIKRSVYKSLGVYNLGYKIAADYELFVRFILKNNIDFKYSSEIRTIMSIGGVSSQGFKSYFLISKEIMQIVNMSNNLFIKLLILSRFLPKYLSSFFLKWNYLFKN